MLNSKLSQHELEESLGNYVERINYILYQLKESESNILFDKNKLGMLHHSLNIANYSQSKFRKKLLARADKKVLLKFLKLVRLSNAEYLKDEQIEDLISQASKLTWGNNFETRTFVEIFGYDKSLIPKDNSLNKEHIICEKSQSPLKILKEYQTKVFFTSLDLVENPWTRFIIKMPTGAGKTRTAMEIICHFINQGKEIKEDRQIVWIADREELCSQAVESMMSVWSHIGKTDLNVYRLWGDANLTNFTGSAFIVATYQKLNSMRKRNIPLPEPHLIITDEAHNVLASTHQETLKIMEKNNTRIIGLTATPISGMESFKLRKFFNDEIIEIDSKSQNTIEYLQGKGYLAQYTPKTIKSNKVYRLTVEDKKYLTQYNDFSNKLLDKISRDDERNIIIFECLKEMKDKNLQVLYFATNVEQSKLMCALMQTLGVKAAHVDGDTPIEYRKDVVAKFRRGEIKFIFNFNVFSTGFDAPNINVVFIARPTKSLVLHQQMIGRGMRGPKMGGTESFQLYRIADDMPGIEVADEYCSDIWKTDLE